MPKSPSSPLCMNSSLSAAMFKPWLSFSCQMQMALHDSNCSIPSHHRELHCPSEIVNLLGKLQPTLLEVTDGISSELPGLGDSLLANDVLIIKSSPFQEELPLPVNPNSK